MGTEKNWLPKFLEILLKYKNRILKKYKNIRKKKLEYYVKMSWDFSSFNGSLTGFFFYYPLFKKLNCLN